MKEDPRPETAVYEIRIQGLLEPQRTHWFEGMTLTTNPERRETLITGAVTDQAALHGLLNKIRDLGVPLLALKQL